ncbi:Hpt domain-containing protein [Qipengyuania sp. DGS5-3]|uniref:Hpt domain-containing protein n=1 Tax=Qipengyuania sp. DGS5-3 TaxID=3349632 RepID=UPI0036D31C82
MALENAQFDAALSAAAGNDASLQLELRNAFVESAELQLDLLKRSRCDANWELAAMRLKGLAASFHAGQLQDLAQEALVSAPGEPTVIREISTHLAEISGQQ